MDAGAAESPKIVNIVNFIRQIEPRRRGGIEEELYSTVVNQIDLLNENGLKGTFLLQYDALINPKYQTLLKEKPLEGTEIGAWWEITEPHVKAAGLEWRGRYPWDWHANVGFATGYSPEEREILVDVYMEKFKEVFGRYPESVGSWFIDAHSLLYMYEKYGIKASCNCKDQYGTDGYTMWGGYWNQGYYPSRVNAYMPAQTREGQIPVPVFRMLGSDPVYQYDNGLGTRMQGVVTLEPVYTGGEGGGGVRTWVEWYLDMIASGECLAYNYVQAGQENSFTWKRMKDGLGMQIPLIRRMADEGLLEVRTLGETGKWFSDRYKVTPPTSVVAEDDFLHTGRRSIWYDSRFYRVNLYWDGDAFRFRDIHLFDENRRSDYIDRAGTSTRCVYTTMPVVDGFLWSTAEQLAGLRLVSEGRTVGAGSPSVEKVGNRTLKVTSGTALGLLRLTLKEDRIVIELPQASSAWSMDLTVAEGASLPFRTVAEDVVSAEDNGYEYRFRLLKGHFEESDNCVWKIVPESGKIILSCITF